MDQFEETKLKIKELRDGYTDKFLNSFDWINRLTEKELDNLTLTLDGSILKLLNDLHGYTIDKRFKALK